jgi:hypothetical protein
MKDFQVDDKVRVKNSSSAQNCKIVSIESWKTSTFITIRVFDDGRVVGEKVVSVQEIEKIG